MCIRVVATSKTLVITVLFNLLCANVQAADRASLVGIWRANWTDALSNSPGVVELILQPNGRYSRQSFSASGFQLTLMGTYQVFVGEEILRLNIQNYSPREWCGPLGCNPILLPAGETLQFQMPDRNTLFTRTTGCAPGTCEALHYQRVGP